MIYLTRNVKAALVLAGAASLGLGGYLLYDLATFNLASLSNAVRAIALSNETLIQAYVRCSTNPTCTIPAYEGRALTFPPMLLASAGILGLAMPLTQLSRERSIHDARLALVADAQEMLISNPFKTERSARARILGRHITLPKNEQLRKRVVAGKYLPRVGRFLAIFPGLGDREEIGHAGYFGITRSGKSATLIYQTLTYKGSIISLDVKGEIYRKTAGYKRQTGSEIVYLSPTGQGDQCNLLRPILDQEDGYTTAALAIATPHLEDRQVFANRAAGLIEAMLRAADFLGVPQFKLIKYLKSLGALEALQYLQTINDEKVNEGVNGFLGVLAGKDDLDFDDLNKNRFLTDSWQNFEDKVRPFLKDEVQHLFSGEGFEPEDVMKRPTAVYLNFPQNTLPATKPVYNLVIKGIMAGMNTYADKVLKNQKPRVPVMLNLDELYAAPVEGLGDYLSTAAGRGIYVNIFVQDPTMLKGPYKEGERYAIMSNLETKVYFKLADLSLAEQLSRYIGKEPVSKTSKSQKRGLHFDPARMTTSENYRDILSPQDILELGGTKRKLILITQTGVKPLLAARLNPYVERKTLERMSHPFPKPPSNSELGSIEVPTLAELQASRPTSQPKPKKLKKPAKKWKPTLKDNT